MTHIAQYESEETIRLVTQSGQFKELWIYAPTHREENLDFIREAILSFDELNAACRARGVLFLFKVHPYTEMGVSVDSFSNLWKLPNTVDLSPLLGLADVLVTDYSSILFDFAITEKKVVFYPFDISKYADWPGLYDSYESIVYDTRVNTFTELLGVIYGDHAPGDKARRMQIAERYWGERSVESDVGMKIIQGIVAMLKGDIR
jgi:CDP-glycerol glycerophosphotransferase (TagB/SpsB family)